LSLNLAAIVLQQRAPRENAKGRVVAFELMLNSPYVSELIQKGGVREIKEQMKKARNQGMQVFDQAPFGLYEAGMISAEDAARHADSQHEVKPALRLQSTHFQNTSAPDARNMVAIEPVRR
jgi:twitching motility protein PilU